MVLVLECGRAKVDESNFRIQENSALSCLPGNCRRRGWYLAIVCEGLVRIMTQEYVLGLQVCVDQVEIV